MKYFLARITSKQPYSFYRLVRAKDRDQAKIKIKKEFSRYKDYEKLSIIITDTIE